MAPMNWAVFDPDLWWHLRDGEWIIAHHAVPHQAVFSQHANLPWAAYSWGSEVVLSRFYHWFGLMGLVILRTGIEVAITVSLFIALGDFWKAISLTALGMWAIHHCLPLQPILFSILLFTIEIGLIWSARRRGRIQPMLFLPPLFLFWANLHIQFIYGVFVLTLLVAVTTFRSLLPGRSTLSLAPEPDLPVRPLIAVWVLSMLATLVNPYSWHLYAVVLEYVRSSIPYNLIMELQALNFRSAGDFVFLLIVAGAFFALGWQRSRDLFKLALLVVCTTVAFRMARDSWFACIPALAVISDWKSVGLRQEVRFPLLQRLAMAAMIAVLTVGVFTLVTLDSKVNNRSLEQQVAGAFPAQACSFIRAHALPGPIYNDMGWGGFVIWSLPEYPVAIDNRTDLYGDEIWYRAYREQQGPPDWKNDPDLNAAKVMLLQLPSPLGRLLSQDHRFKLVYYDDLAVVFVANNDQTSHSPASPNR